MRRASSRVRVLAAALLIAAPTAAISGGLGGSWSGTVTQNDPPESYEMNMELYGEKGSIEYPTLGCSGDLLFLRRDGASYWYREQLRSGAVPQGQCIDGGTIMIKPHAIGGSPDWEWNWYNGEVTVRGVVRGAGAPR